MFKNIFPDKLNRLVYMGAPKGEVPAIIETEKRKPGASPEDLKKEQKALNASIDDYVKKVETDINFTRSAPNEPLKINLSDPESYKDAPDFYVQLLKAIGRLKEDLNTFEPNERNLDYVHRQMRAYHLISTSLRAVGDPFMHSAELNRVAKARPADANKSKTETARKTVEVAEWIKIANLVQEYRDLEFTRARRKNEKPEDYEAAKKANAARQAEIGKELIPLAQKVLKPGETVYRQGNLIIRNKPGEKAYHFELNKTGSLRPTRAASRTHGATAMVEKVTINAS